MSDEGDCRTAPATPGLLNIMAMAMAMAMAIAVYFVKSPLSRLPRHLR